MSSIEPPTEARPFAGVIEQLRAVGLRPTRQRMALAKLLLEKGNRHVTAEMIHAEAQTAGVKVSLATVYNTLHQFTDVGLLKEIVVDSTKSYFDTNRDAHHHFFHERSGRLEDIPASAIELARLPAAPEGMTVSRVDVIVRVDKA